MILLTGTTGKSGRWFLKNLINGSDDLKRNHYRVVVRTPSSTDITENSGLSIEKVYGDLHDAEFLDRVTKGVETVFHVAGIHTSWGLVQAAVKNHVKWIILVHTTGIYSKYKAAGEEYRQTEKKIEDLIKSSGCAMTILRPTMIYGSIKDANIAIFIAMVDKLRLFPVVDNAAYALQPVHEKDLGDAYYEVLARREVTLGKNYILSGKEPILLIDIFKTIAGLLNKKCTFISIPYPLAYSGAWFFYVASLGRFDYREKVQRLVEPRVFSHEDAKRDFGYSPRSFEEGVREEVQEYITSARTR